MLIKEINIKKDMPPADVAVANMEIAIEALANSEYSLIKVIHGYGSHGRGGEIKQLARERLKYLKKTKKILDYIEGEKLGIESLKRFNIVKNFPELILQNDVRYYNNGITLVLLNNINKF